MEFTPEWLQRYLSHRLGEPVRVTGEDITRFPRGSSRETWFIRYTSAAGGEPRTLVFRLDFRSGSTDPSSLDQEYFLYERLGQTAVPVPKVLWWEEDPAWTDRPFYTRLHVEGDWDVPHYLDPSPAYDELRIEISKEHMRKLALVHNVDWKTLGLDSRLTAPPSPERCAQTYVEVIERYMEEVRSVAIPLFLEAAEWLKDQAPAAPRICLCKGTNGLGEEVFRGREIVAMSDWEEASLGDPAADFASLQNFMPEIERDGKKIWGLEPALDYYRSVSGIDVSPERVGYYFQVRALKTVLFAQKAATSAHRSVDAPVRQTWTGTEVLHVGKRGLAAAMGLLPPLSAEHFSELNKLVSQR
jgi:aminoglycoside phosphotransferase (APT) family kinase protein